LFLGIVIVASPSHFGREAVVPAPCCQGFPLAFIRAAEKKDNDSDGHKPNGDNVADVAAKGKVYAVQSQISSALLPKFTPHVITPPLHEIKALLLNPCLKFLVRVPARLVIVDIVLVNPLQEVIGQTLGICGLLIAVRKGSIFQAVKRNIFEVKVPMPQVEDHAVAWHQGYEPIMQSVLR
jgi:hypothetical protein